MSREVSGAATATAVRLCIAAQPPLKGCRCSCPHKDTAAVVLLEFCDGCCLFSIAITALLLVVIGRSCVISPKKNVTVSARMASFNVTSSTIVMTMLESTAPKRGAGAGRVDGKGYVWVLLIAQNH